MIKKSVIALVASAALASISAPAFAIEDSPRFDTDYVLSKLQSQGIAATDVEEWGELVRAYVVTAEGRQVMQFFDADTLQPVQL